MGRSVYAGARTNSANRWQARSRLPVTAEERPPGRFQILNRSVPSVLDDRGRMVEMSELCFCERGRPSPIAILPMLPDFREVRSLHPVHEGSAVNELMAI